jgi:DNA-binding MarR family transcriptional regulator
VVLTAEGKNIVEKSIKARQSWIREIPVGLRDDQLDEITAALQLLISTYQE